MTAIAGPNGAGKSTLLKALMGELPLAGGRTGLVQDPKFGPHTESEQANGDGRQPHAGDAFYDSRQDEYRRHGCREVE